VQLQQKFAFPFVEIIMTVLAVPSPSRPAQRRDSTALAWGSCWGIIYRTR